MEQNEHNNELNLNGQVMGTPSICSLEDQLQRLNSPAYSDNSVGDAAKNKG